MLFVVVVLSENSVQELGVLQAQTHGDYFVVLLATEYLFLTYSELENFKVTNFQLSLLTVLAV